MLQKIEDKILQFYRLKHPVIESIHLATKVCYLMCNRSPKFQGYK